ncbi:MAG: hypothetical protein KID00_01015 [Clostridium argentinense]|nr:hypothetical protein [Clostridium argentinense]
MADVIVLSDESVHVIFQPKDFGYLVEQYMGYDAEKYFNELNDQLQSEAIYTKAKIETDLGCYESSLESNTACFQDILEVMEEMKSILETPRTNKQKMFKLIEQVQKQINNQI